MVHGVGAQHSHCAIGKGGGVTEWGYCVAIVLLDGVVQAEHGLKLKMPVHR